MFCQFFFNKDAKKLVAKMMLVSISSGDISQLAMAMFRHKTFFIWNLIVAPSSLSFAFKSSVGETTVGNLPARFRPGPSRRGTFLISLADAKKPSYFPASFLTSFLSFLNFFKSSSVNASRPTALAFSQSASVPSKQYFRPGFGTFGSLKVPLKRLSLDGS